ncbi:MAG: hypothetical protein J6Z82_06850, partial [Schwartzia sp.]|nr:hypothetical protein [Schwartzia sp. (in: firmicutes)]
FFCLWILLAGGRKENAEPNKNEVAAEKKLSSCDALFSLGDYLFLCHPCFKPTLGEIFLLPKFGQ